MNTQKYDQKPFHRGEVDPNNHTGWVVALSPGGNTIYPDCYWYFATRKQAIRFLDLLNTGYTPDAAAHYANPA